MCQSEGNREEEKLLCPSLYSSPGGRRTSPFKGKGLNCVYNKIHNRVPFISTLLR